MKKEDIPIIENIIGELEKAEEKLESYYYDGNAEMFNDSKKQIILLQKKILDIIR